MNKLDLPMAKNRTGRPQANPYDMLKLAILKVYQGRSLRRAHSFNLLYAHSGFVTKPLKRTTINRVYNEEFFTPYLEQLYRSMADYLVPYEESFAIDSTGFGTRYSSRWVKVKLDFKKHKDYKKLHAVCGVNTHIITEVKVTKGTVSDNPQLPELIGKTAKRFSIHRVCADGRYISGKNVQFVEDLGAAALIMPKKNASGRAKGSRTAAYRRMLRGYWEDEERWKKVYHLRQQIEVCYSMMKTTLLDGLLCKNDLSQKNELLMRVICHNISVLVEAVFRFYITPFDG